MNDGDIELFSGLSEYEKNVIALLIYEKNFIDDTKKYYINEFSVEAKLYLLYMLFKNIANPNIYEGITGLSFSLTQFYELYLNKDPKLMPDEIYSEIARLTKEKETFLKDDKEIDKFIINRSDFCYVKINHFKEFEFSNNIAFEFAKRSIYLYPEYEQLYLFRRLLANYFQEKFKLTIKSNIYQTHYYKQYVQENEIFLELFDFFCDKNLTMDKIYENFKPIFNTVREFEDINDFYKHTYQYFDAYSIDYLNLKRTDEYRSNFKSPSLPESEFLSIDCRINFSLPENELVDYIKQLRKIMIKENDLIDIDIFKLMFGDKVNYHNQISDLLFTYDATRIGMKFSHIENSIKKYNDSINSDIYTKDTRTLKKYLKYAKLFIEEGYYRAIISKIYAQGLEEKIKNIS